MPATAYRCADGWILENRYLRCLVNENGQLVSVKKQGSDTEYLSGVGNRFLMFKDVNTCYDAWELGSMYENLPVELEQKAEIEILDGPDNAVLKVRKRLHDSLLEQRIILNHNEEILRFDTTIQWNENHKLLKVAFPVSAHAAEAIHETQFGYVRRPTHRSYRTDRDCYEVCNHRYTALTDGAHGAAVLNDGKYGVNVVGSEIRLTLLKAAMMPDMNADRGMQKFVYGFYPFDGAFADSDVLQKAAELNEPMIVGSVDGAMDAGPILVPDRKNIVVETVKPADTADNALLVRAYEAMGKQTDCAFTANPKITRIVETDMLEEHPQTVDARQVSFGPFEIKTFLLYL